jgi:predicted nucleic acid-binding protein
LSKAYAPITPRKALRVEESRANYETAPQVLVVDCSVIAAQIFQEPEREVAARGMGASTLCAPHLLPYEIASVAQKKDRRGEHEVSQLGIELFSAMEVGLHSVNVSQVCELASAYKLSAYDASYLWLAKHLDAPLFTFDRTLQRAAEEYLGEA